MNWVQLRTMLWLRWRLTRNQWGRGGQLNAVITLIAAVAGVGMGLAGGVAGVVCGVLLLGEVSPLVVMLVWDGVVAAFLFFWMIGVVSELQRSEIIDLSRLMHLPVSLREVFLLNYLASHLSLSIAIMVPMALGLTAGLVLGRGPAMLLLLPLGLGFVFMITAWTYCLRGWLATLMVNQRRRRAIVMGVTLFFVLLAQTPNLVINVWMGGSSRAKASAFGKPDTQAQLKQVARVAHTAVPFLWLPQGARGLAEGRWWPALLGAAGTFGLGALGLGRAYHSTVRFYQGAGSSKPSAPKDARPVVGNRGRILLERRPPLVPEEAAALALANFRSLTRAPEVKMALGMNVFIFVMLGAGVFMRGGDKVPEEVRPLLASAAVAITFLGLLQVLFNQFGFDREGFRALVLLPTPRRLVLLGKNLAFLPLGLAVFAVLLTLMAVLGRVPWWALAGAGLQFAGAFLSLSAAGNLISILAPHRVAAGSLKPTKTKATTVFLMMFVNMLFPVAMFPIVIPAILGVVSGHYHWLPAWLVTLALSALLAAAAGALYWFTLAPLGRLLQRREQKILQVVTQEVE